ncbi:MAG: RsmB/NOP family class I SAM-dependent RNA methyltransferase [Treponema sp.]|nr:RsmB/NOP family class I SAM-dependent RNA methyltransferase [Candidatus Treponema merdequi]
MSKKTKANDPLRGAQGFDLYYSEIFSDRWSVLKEALLKEAEPVSYNLTSLQGSSEVSDGNENPEELRTYFLDSASILAASSLPLKNAKNILDLCAAPGGKTLVLSSLMPDDAQLTANERSAERKHRLVKVCDEHMSQNIRNRVTITCSDGAVWCKTKSECYDRILLDAPCSSERHVLQDEKYLKEWSPARIKTLSMEQWALLSSAWRLLQKGGYMVYSTCALAPKENDSVIERLLKKFDDAEILTFESEEYLSVKNNLSILSTISPDYQIPPVEKTEFGYHVLPDSSDGAGPIYFSIIFKKLN